MIVIDASVLMMALAEEGERAHYVRRRLVDVEMVAPHLVDVEVASAIRRGHRAGRIDSDRIAHAFLHLGRLRLRRIGHASLLDRIWELRENLSAYDATYVALAERLRAPLLTADARLAGAPGVRCDVQLVG